MLLELKDGGIYSIKYDDAYIGGSCDTCDYGEKFINNIEIELEKIKIEVYVVDEDGYVLSEGFMMNVMLRNIDDIKSMTERGFAEWLEETIKIHLEGRFAELKYKTENRGQ